jgi:citrate lyase subunit beta/citryl-CoA lyase
MKMLPFRRRSLLFVPGNNERMLRKAMSNALVCDCVIIDLEDSVPFEQKENARKLIRKILAESKTGKNENKKIYLRINQLDSSLSKADISSFMKEERIENFVVPKAEEKGIKQLYHRTGKNILSIIESSKGFLQIENIARSKGVDGVAYGAADMALSMRGTVETFRDNEYIRTRLAVVARSYGIDPIDQVFFDLNDIAALRKEAKFAKSLGYSGKLLIHPSQIDIVNQVFSTTSEQDRLWAKQVIEAYEESIKKGTKGAIRLNGQLIDAVHYKLAKDILLT